VTTLTGAYLAERRHAKGLTRGQLAAALGYTNIAKGANRIVHLERDGKAVAGLLDKIVDVLALDRHHVQKLLDEDRRRVMDEWERWASEAVEPQLRRRLMPAVWGGAQMPKDLSRTEAVEFARTRAVEERLTYVLIWSRWEEIWCYPAGTTLVRTMDVGEAAGPCTRLRGRGNRGFTFG
jgi:transcriptional regulator with XRE-family HTH domain